MLRDYQEQMILETRAAIASGARAPLLVAPTGSGKTHVAAAMISSALDKDRMALFLAPRRELIYQTSERLDRAGISYGVIMAGEPPSLMSRVQVASIPTLYARAIQREKIWLPKADLVLVDEAHIGVGGQSQKILDHYKREGAIVVGLSATPARTDGRGLGELYDALVLGPSVADLMAQEHLVPARYFVGERPDLSGVKIQAGDYHQGQLAERVDKPKLVGDIVSNWLRLASDRQTFVFATSVAHSRHLCDEFRSAGVSAEHLDGQTPLEERKAIVERLKSGDIQVLTNCLVMTYGVDFPPVSCIVFASPTKSVVRYMQSVGRGLRTYPGKEDCLVLDHAGAVNDPDLGFVDDPRPWSLDGKEKIQDRQAALKKQPKEITCRSCGTTFRSRPVCPKCGQDMRAEHRKAVEVLEAELVEIDRARQKKSNKAGMDKAECAQFYAELRGYGQQKGYLPGWAMNAYKAKTGAWPDDPAVRTVAPKQPGPETLKWVQHLNIKRAKSKYGSRHRATA